MKTAPVPSDEIDRQKSLEAMGLLSTPRDPELDRITRLAERLFGSDMLRYPYSTMIGNFLNRVSIFPFQKQVATFHFVGMR